MNLTRRSVWILIIVILLLIGLYLASTTDLIFSEQEQPIYNISILVDSYTDDGWKNFKTGVNKAALEFNVDVNFVTLLSENVPISAEERVARELDSNAQALIIYSEDRTDLAALIECTPINIPLILLGEAPEPYEVHAVVSSNLKQMGRDLAARLAAEQGQDKSVLILHNEGQWLNLDCIEEAFRAELVSSGFDVSLQNVRTLQQLRQMIEKVQHDENLALAVFEPGFLEYLINILNDPEVSVYGTGWSDVVRRGVESGLVNAVVAADEYERGYLSVQQAVQAISESMLLVKDNTVGHIVFGQAEIYQKPYEIILFPIK